MRSDVRRRWGQTRGRGAGEGEDTGELFGMASELDAQEAIGRDFGRPEPTPLAERLERLVPLAQGAYYLATGLWPLLHMRSFEAVTGRKTDKWLVRTVGTLAAAIGATLLQGARRRHVPPEVRTLSLLSAAGFTAVEIPTVLGGRISPVYLADAAVESAFLLGNALAGGLRETPGERLDRLVAEEAREWSEDARDWHAVP